MTMIIHHLIQIDRYLENVVCPNDHLLRLPLLSLANKRVVSLWCALNGREKNARFESAPFSSYRLFLSILISLYPAVCVQVESWRSIIIKPLSRIDLIVLRTLFFFSLYSFILHIFANEPYFCLRSFVKLSIRNSNARCVTIQTLGFSPNLTLRGCGILIQFQSLWCNRYQAERNQKKRFNRARSLSDPLSDEKNNSCLNEQFTQAERQQEDLRKSQLATTIDNHYKIKATSEGVEMEVSAGPMRSTTCSIRHYLIAVLELPPRLIEMSFGDELTLVLDQR